MAGEGILAMRSIRAVLCLAMIAMGLGSVLIWHSPATVLATTGPTTVATPAKYRVDRTIAMRYPGQYMMQTVAEKARLAHGQMAIEINSLGYLQGVAQFNSYDAHGQQSTWTAFLYNFHLTAHDVMAIGLYSVFGSGSFGTLYVQRTKQGDLIGRIALPSTPYAIRWRKTLSL